MVFVAALSAQVVHAQTSRLRDPLYTAVFCNESKQVEMVIDTALKDFVAPYEAVARVSAKLPKTPNGEPVCLFTALAIKSEEPLYDFARGKMNFRMIRVVATQYTTIYKAIIENEPDKGLLLHDYPTPRTFYRYRYIGGKK